MAIPGGVAARLIIITIVAPVWQEVLNFIPATIQTGHSFDTVSKKREMAPNSGNDKPSKFALYILGAGFSRSAGLPIAQELWEEVLHRGLAMTGRAAKFRDDLDNYIEFRKRCDGAEFTYETIDFEEFLGFLDVEHYLGLRGSDTWSDEGNEGQIVVKTLIGQILTERTPPTTKIPEIYLNFVRRLRPRDVIITFNYDVLLERSLDAAGMAYRLFRELSG